MLCPHCAYPNEPTQSHCLKCGLAIQSKESAKKTQELWATAPPQVIKEFEQKYQKEQERYERYITFLKNNLIKHSLLGGFINIIIGLFTYLPSIGGISFLIYLLLNAITGAIAGWLLNKKGGGNFTGLFLIWAAFVIPLIIRMINVSIFLGNDMQQNASAFGSFFLPGFIGSTISATVGYFFGTQLEFERIGRGL